MDKYIIYSILNSLLALLLVVSVYKVIKHWGILYYMNKKIKMIIGENDLILVKASNGMKFTNIVDIIKSF